METPFSPFVSSSVPGTPQLRLPVAYNDSPGIARVPELRQRRRWEPYPHGPLSSQLSGSQQNVPGTPQSVYSFQGSTGYRTPEIPNQRRPFSPLARESSRLNTPPSRLLPGLLARRAVAGAFKGTPKFITNAPGTPSVCGSPLHSFQIVPHVDTPELGWGNDEEDHLTTPPSSPATSPIKINRALINLGPLMRLKGMSLDSMDIETDEDTEDPCPTVNIKITPKKSGRTTRRLSNPNTPAIDLFQGDEIFD